MRKMQLLRQAVMNSGICVPGVSTMSGCPGAESAPVLTPSYLIRDIRTGDSHQSVKVSSVWLLSGSNLALDSYAMFQPVICEGGEDMVYNNMMLV